MKRALFFLVLSLFVGGCATSTVDKRKQERASAYSELAPEMRALLRLLGDAQMRGVLEQGEA